MQCTSCRVFEGSPVCGACKTAKRILGIVQGGHLPLAREREVLETLRGCAGILCDLAEEEVPAKGVAREHPAERGGDTALDPGAKRAKIEEPPKERSDTEYSYESAEEEVAEEEKPNWDRESPSPDPPKRTHREGASTGHRDKPGEARPSSRGRVAGGVDPHYLSKALQKDLPRWSAAYHEAEQEHRDEGRGSEGKSSSARPRHHGRGKEEEQGPCGDGSRRPKTPEREPLQRKPQPKRKNRTSRGSGGKKKRERASHFKQWVEERKKAKKEKQTWHPKQQ